MAETRDYAAGAAGLGVGGLVGRGLADSDFANSLLVRWLTRKAPAAGKPDFRVPVYAGADLNLEHGSGEAVMGSRISRMLQRHGVGSYYVNTNWRPNDGDIARGFNLPEGGRDPWWSKDVGNNAKLWSDNTRIDGSNLRNLRRLRTNFGGRQGTALSEIVSRMGAAGVPRREVLRLLRSGAFTQFTPGELLDTFKVVGNKGIADIAAGDYAAAELQINEMLTEKPNGAMALNLKASLEAAQGRQKDAERTLDQAIMSNPRSHFAYYNMAELLLQKTPDDKNAARRYYETGRAVGGPKDEDLEEALK